MQKKTKTFFLYCLFVLNVMLNSMEKSPNIVLILADDMGYADCGIHGCKDIPTPNIDRIANQGVRFTQAYANGSFCTPTRIALMTGRYQQRTGNDDLPEITGPLPLEIKMTLADHLKKAGYTTCLTGKWHMGEGDGYLPLDRGFEKFFGFHGGGHTYFPEKIDPSKAVKGYKSPIYRQEKAVKETRYLTTAFGEEAAAFIKGQQNAQKPFFLFLSFNAVHTPMEAAQDYLKRFPELKGKRKTYAAMLSAMDDAVGLVLKELEASSMLKNTLVIFNNDNGGPTTRNAVNGSVNTPLRGSKCETFEGGIRVPLFMMWPEMIKAGSSYDKAVMTFDITATLLNSAKTQQEKPDGVNLLPFLSGEKTGNPHEALFWRSRTRNNNYAVLRNGWKYVYSTQGTEQKGPNQTPARHMLFNVNEDIQEEHDLSQKYPEILNELKALYKKWDAEMDEDCKSLGLKLPQVKK